MDDEQITEPTDELSEEVSSPIESGPPTVTEDSIPKEPQPNLAPTPDSTPVGEAPVPTPEPAPEPILPTNPSTLDPIPAAPTPTPDLVPIPKLTPVPEPPLTNSLPRSSSPELTTVDNSPITAVFDVAQLSDEQLKAAAALYTRRNQLEISRKGVAKRKETMELNLREIVDFLSHNNGSPLPRIAKNTNITPGTTSKYLRQLIANGKVRAEGWGKTRRYYLK